MKKLILTAFAALGSAVVFASTVESSNIFGVLKVSLPAGEGQYFVGVPWDKVGNGNINPIDLVLTKGLHKGDRLYVYGHGTGNDKFGSWVLNADEGTWTSSQVVDSEEQVVYPAGSVDAISRGSGFVIATSASEVYLSGQYSDVVSTGVTIAAGTTETPVYTLISAQVAEDFDLNTGVTWSAKPNAGDEIFVSGTVYYWRNSANDAWVKSVKGPPADVTSTGVTLTKGRGAWYKNTGSELTLKFGTNL